MKKDFEKETDKTIGQLLKLGSTHYPILTVYLGFEGKKVATSSLLATQFHSQVHQHLGEKERKYFKKDLIKIDDYVNNQLDTHGKRSLVIFSSGKNLWEVMAFEFFLPPLLVVCYLPYLNPILEAVNRYLKYLVILVDREKARLFSVRFGEISEHLDVFDDKVPQNVKAGDDSWDQQNKIFRHIEDHLHRHLKLISETVDDFVKNNPVSFVIIGGHQEMIGKFKKHLNYPLNKMVLGEFVTAVNSPLNKVFLQSKRTARQVGSLKNSPF